jgi:hypothetical protein
VTLDGPPDPLTGMVCDLKKLRTSFNARSSNSFDIDFERRDAALRSSSFPPREHGRRNLAAAGAWPSPPARAPPRLRLYETEDLCWSIAEARSDAARTRYRFSAAHRLTPPPWAVGERPPSTASQQPFGHGHVYALEIALDAPGRLQAAKLIVPRTTTCGIAVLSACGNAA